MVWFRRLIHGILRQLHEWSDGWAITISWAVTLVPQAFFTAVSVVSLVCGVIVVMAALVLRIHPEEHSSGAS